MVERTNDPWADYVEPPGLPSKDDPWADFVTAAPTTEPTARITVRPQSAYDTFKDVARSASNAATYGQMDRARAGIDVALGDQPDYDTALKEVVKRSREAEERAGPFLTSTGQAVGGIASGVPLARAGATFMRAGQPIAQKIIAGLGEGAIHGGIQGAGNTYTGNAQDYASNALMGGVLGGGLGAAAPVVGKAGSAAYHGLANRGQFGGLPRPLVDAARADERGLVDAMIRPGGMLPDAGPSMLGVTMGANTGAGGPGKTRLERNLRARDQAQPFVIGDELRRFGPAPTPSHVEEAIRNRMGQLSPHYERAYNNARAVDTNPVALWIEGEIGNTRGPAQAALRQVRSMLDIPTNPGTLDPHPRSLGATREAVRDMRDNPNAEPGVRRVMDRVYNQLTDEMQRRIPGIQRLDHAYAELGAQERAITAQSAGGRIFKTDQGTVQRPVELAETMLEAAQPKGINVGPSAEPFRLRQAARAELERVVGTNKNDLAKLEGVLGNMTDWNAHKLGTMFGEERAGRLLQVLNRLRDEREVFQKVVHGSKTATTSAAAAQLDAAQGNIPVETSATGVALRLMQEAYKNVRGGASDAQRDAIARRLAATSGPEKQQLVAELLLQQPTRNRRADITQMLIERGIIGGGTAATAPTTRP